VFRQLEASGVCGSATGQSACDATGFCMCQINQEAGADLSACQANAATATPGFCYIDDPASAAVGNCPSNQKRLLRFVDGASTKTPAQGAISFIACVGAPITTDAGM